MARKKVPQKRAYGEGGVFQRKDNGLWVAFYPITGTDGRRTRKTKTAKTEAEATAKYDEMKRDAAQGLVMSTRELTVRQFLTSWLEDTIKPSDHSARTYEDYAGTITRHVGPRIGDVSLARLTPQDVQRTVASVTKAVSPQMATRCRRILRAALTLAVKWGYITRNVAALTDAPKTPRREMHALTATEAHALLTTAAGDRLEALYTVALALGLRKGEALVLCHSGYAG